MHNRVKKYIRNLIIPNNIQCILKGQLCTFKNTKNQEILTTISKEINLKIEKNTITISSDTTNSKALINTTCVILKNNIKGLLNSFEKTLIIKGVGYKAEYKNKVLNLSLGFSHSVIFNIPDDIEIILTTPTTICIKGISKYKVGQIAHNIKSKRPIEIYKGNGIKYKDEIIKLKSAKKTK